MLQPSVLLLDEPLGALDAKLRRSLKVELKALQEQVGITFLYVTHDQEEALTMSDRLAVMRDGKIVQIGAPTEVYEEPADTYVADFLGVSNLMEVDIVERGPGTRCQARLGETVLTVDHGGQDAPDHSHAVIRPERVKIEDFGSAGPNRVPAMVERLVYLGSIDAGVPAPGGRDRPAGGAAERRQPDGLEPGHAGARVPGPGRAARAGGRRAAGRAGR